MSQQLISLSPDLQRLRDEGLDLEIKSGYLLVKDVPFVNSRKEVSFGTLVSELTFGAGNITTKPGTHVAQFIGEHPCHKNGAKIAQIANQSNSQTLAPGVTIDHTFSSKPKGGYSNYYDKIKTYYDIVSGPAYSLEPDLKLPEPIVLANADSESVFRYVDSASTRAGIVMANQKLKLGSVAIVGLGGTGSYVLDHLTKTPVNKIHLFDGKVFEQHSAFRAPGAASPEDLRKRWKKVDYYAEIYSRMRTGIVPHPDFVTEANVQELSQFDFVFVCVDNGAARKLILESLGQTDVPFIDVGMGLYFENDAIGGIVRVTASTAETRDEAARFLPVSDMGEDPAYSTNIQTSELNALNAVHAVIKWKKLVGFYHDFDKEVSMNYTIDGNTINNEAGNGSAGNNAQVRRSNPR